MSTLCGNCICPQPFKSHSFAHTPTHSYCLRPVHLEQSLNTRKLRESSFLAKLFAASVPQFLGPSSPLINLYVTPSRLILCFYTLGPSDHRQCLLRSFHGRLNETSASSSTVSINPRRKDSKIFGLRESRALYITRVWCSDRHGLFDCMCTGFAQE